MGVIEVLHNVGVGRERRPKPFEQAKRVMEEAGGKELLKGIAIELRENGDPSFLVLEDIPRWSPNVNFVTLRWGLSKMPYLASSWWSSKGVRIAANSNGRVSVELTGSHGWIDTETLKARYASYYGRKVEELFPQKDESLEEKVRFAMERAGGHVDFRYGEGEQSLKQKPVKSKFSKRIF